MGPPGPFSESWRKDFNIRTVPNKLETISIDVTSYIHHYLSYELAATVASLVRSSDRIRRVVIRLCPQAAHLLNAQYRFGDPRRPIQWQSHMGYLIHCVHDALKLKGTLEWRESRELWIWENKEGGKWPEERALASKNSISELSRLSGIFKAD